MASHGRHGISAFILGSETLKVLTYPKSAYVYSKIPVPADSMGHPSNGCFNYPQFEPTVCSRSQQTPPE
jgi:hypothetical protein